jgi:hypothetical protein
MKIAYFDCFAGAAGDMIAGAMLDAGLDQGYLLEQLATLGVEGLNVEINSAQRCGIRAITFKPVAPDGQHHRSIKHITAMIEKSGIPEMAKQRAIEVFGRLATVEAGIHGKDVNEIHFHEIGAVDSIVDIVTACIGFERLGIEKVCCSTLAVGSGTVKCAHGIMPVPAPATAELLGQMNAPVTAGPGSGELLTPTAAAIFAVFVDEFGTIPAMNVESNGYGAGTRESGDFANVVRLTIGEAMASENNGSDRVCLLETNIDDATGEVVGNTLGKLLANGALDAYSQAINMKNNRPAVKLSVICKPEAAAEMERIIFTEGVTFGIRRQLIQRSKLDRRFVTVETEFGDISVKIGAFEGSDVTAKPEYADCAKAATEYNVALKTVQQAAMRAFDTL